MNAGIRKFAAAVAVVAAVALGSTALADDNQGFAVGPGTVVFYEDGALEIWTIWDAENNFWSPVITLSGDELAEHAQAPEEHTLVASSGSVALYKLSSDEWQVNSGPDAEGKISVLVFNESFEPTNHYELNVYGEDAED
jgi:hypothetical protein